MSRKRLLLLLLVVLALALWYAWRETPRQQKIVSGQSVEERSTASVPSKRSGFDVVSLDFAGGEKLTYKKPKRDLFRPLFRAPAVVVKKPVVPIMPEPVEVEMPPPPPPKPQTVVRPVTGSKPIPPLNVLGFLQKGADTTVFLISRQGDKYLVKKGDRFAGGLLVRELDEEKIVISRGQTDQGLTLKVGEPKKQRMAIPEMSSGRPSVPTFNNSAPKANRPAMGVGQN